MPVAILPIYMVEMETVKLNHESDNFLLYLLTIGSRKDIYYSVPSTFTSAKYMT